MDPTRRFVLTLPAVAVLVRLLPACGDGYGNGGSGDCSGAGDVSSGDGTLTVTSSCKGGHTHDLSIQESELAMPPAAGLTRDTTRIEGGHNHKVTLTAAQLAQIQGGETVTVTSTSSGGHTHGFELRKA
jgi:hypothetical protein